MRRFAKTFAGRLSIVLVIAMVLSIMAPACAANKVMDRAVTISSFTDASGSININVGNGEGVKAGATGVIIRDGKQIAKYVVQQVNWGFSRIAVSDLAPGESVKVGDSAPLTGTPATIKKSSKSKTLWIVAGIAAAVLLLSGRSSGGSSSGDSTIAITTEKASTVTNGDATCTVTITARVSKSDGSAVDDGTAVTLSTSSGTLNRTQTTTTAGRATATLTSDPLDSAETATITVRSGGRTARTTVSFVSSIDLEASQTTIQVSDSSGTQTQTTITATCLDASDNPATTGNVKFTSSIGTVTETVPIVGGVATTTFRSSTVGKATITATWSKSKATTQVTVTAGPPYSVIVNSSTGTLSCDGSSFATVTATVKDARSNTAADGTVVDFSVIPDGTGGGNGTITARATTVNGVATAQLLSRDSTGATSKSGTGRIKAEVLRANQPSTVPLPLADIANQTTVVQFVSLVVDRIVLSASSMNIRSDSGSTTVTAKVFNADGVVIPNGTVVSFSSTHGGWSASTGQTTSGSATVTLTADGFVGKVDITATAGSITQSQPGLVCFSGLATDANTEVTSSQATINPVGGSATITVIAKDVNGNPVADGSNITVGTAPAGMTWSSTNAITTNGRASLTITTSTDASSPTPLGAKTVSITVDSVTKTVSFTVGS